jgi:chromate transporter
MSEPGETAPAPAASAEHGPAVTQVPLRTVLREWGRIGCIGFGGPPAHIRLLRQLCVERRGWLDAREFEDAIAVCNLMPGPASTQLAIFCAWRLRGRLGALIGGAAFIIPGLIVILALAVPFVASSPPLWVLGAGAGAGAAVPAVAVQAGWSLLVPSWGNRAATVRWLIYLAAGLAAAATVGPWLVLVLLGCGAIELGVRSAARPGASAEAGPLRGVLAAPFVLAAGGGVLASVAWVAFKVGGLSFGGGFVIIPLMQADAVNHYHWMTGAQFLNAVALGQITPGPVVQTVAVVGYAAAGLAGGLLASAVAFTPSFLIILFGGPRFQQIRGNQHARAFLDGAGPAAIGAILGSAITLTRELTHPWQYAVLAGALVVLLPLRRGVVLTLLTAAAIGITIALAAGTVSPLSGPSGRRSRGSGGPAEREGEGHGCSATRAAAGRDLAAVGLGGGADDRQAEAEVTGGAAACVGPGEFAEYPVELPVGADPDEMKRQQGLRGYQDHPGQVADREGRPGDLGPA